MSNATFSRKPLVAAVLTTLAVFSAGAMAEPVNKDVTLTVGTGANTVPNTIKDEKTWDEDWAKTFNKNFTNASGKVTIEGQNSDKITISKDEANKTAGKLTNKLSSLTLNVGLDVAEGGTFVNNGTLEANKAITVTGSLVNTGTLKIKDNLTINGLNKTDDLEAAPPPSSWATSRSRTPPSRTMTRATSSRPKPRRRKAKPTRSPKRALA